MDLEVTLLLEDDWDAVRTVYQEGIDSGQATFENRVPTWAKWSSSKLPECRLVLRLGSEIVGWAALSPISRRAVYKGVAEVSIYIAGRWHGQGAGKALLLALIRASEAAGIWTLQAVTFPENEASVALHKSCGFREVGRRERIAQQEGVWRDTILLERRSGVVG